MPLQHYLKQIRENHTPEFHDTFLMAGGAEGGNGSLSFSVF